MVNEKLLRLLRPDSILINCARGAVVNQAVLIDLVAKGRMRAGLDVYEGGEKETMPLDSPLRGMPDGNLVTMPHIGYKCQETLRRRQDITIANILAFFADS